jgi:hypothetical protein
MAKDPGKRYHSPGRLMRAVGEALGVEATVPVLVPPPGDGRAAVAPRRRQQARAPARPRRLGLAVLLPVAAVCGLLAGMIDWSGSEPRAPTERVPAAADRAQRAAHFEAVGAAVEGLAARRVALRLDVLAARRPAGQATAARALAEAYERALRAMPAPSTPRETSIRAALRDTESAYRRLAAAARARDRAAWRRAGVATERREARLERALRGPG